jgi:polysaccharide biosynthesis/export protein
MSQDRFMFVHLRIRRGTHQLLTAVGLVLAGLEPASAQYLVAPGDVLEISVVGLPELRQKAQVDPDGQISYPLIGNVVVAGHSLAEIQSKLKNELTNKSVRSSGPDRSESTVYIRPDEVAVSIAEYRPVYVNGDVSKPGEISYRPNLTVRQAVALAGGIDTMRFRTRDPNLEQVDLRSEGKLLKTEYIRQQTFVARLKAELNDSTELKVGEDLAATPGASELQKTQSEQLKLALIDRDQEISSLGRALDQTIAQIGTLQRLQQEMTETQKQQATDLLRLRGAFEKGLASMARITDEQRNLAFATERLLQTEAQLRAAKRGEEEQRRELQKAEAERRLRLMRELQEAEAKLSDTQTKIRAADEKLIYMGSVRSNLVAQAGQPRFQVVRKNGSKWDIHDANEDMALSPGDVVEVELQQAMLTPDRS